MKKRLVILGGKESGTGAAVLGKKLGYDVFLSDRGVIEEKYKEVIRGIGVPFEEGHHTQELLNKADLVVKSPGIPDTAAPVVELRHRGIEVISEIEFAGRHSDARMICITGSNGKTTTTLLTHHILKRAGLDVGLAGNVGASLAEQVARNAHPMYVIELSSFQLDGMSRFRADVAVITNITPDHLDRYNHCFDNYVSAKFRILQNMDDSGLFVYGHDCEVVRKRVAGMEGLPKSVPFSYGRTLLDEGGNGAGMDGDEVVVRMDGREFRLDKNEISIKGRHNVYNAMAAIVTAMRMGIPTEVIADGLRTFPQVPHRLETVGVVDGVTYVNDSKATNVDSAWYALDSMTTPVVWIAGGTDKGNDYSVLNGFVKKKVRVLVCMGVDNRKLVESFSPLCKVEDTGSLDEAWAAIRKYARPGDTVLLSPCCASFDLFKNYEDRGDKFRAKVKQLMK